MKKKIMFVVEAFGGGIFTYIQELSNSLIDEFDITIVYSIRRQTPTNFKNLFDNRVKFIYLKEFTRTISPINDIRAFFRLRRINGLERPDIIHLHSSKAGVIGRWAFDDKEQTLFYTPHGYSFLMSNQSKFKRLLFKYIEIISAKRKCVTIACSLGEYKESRAINKQSVYINNGVDTEQIDGDILHLKATNKHVDRRTIFTIGRISYQKNPDLFNKIALCLPQYKFIWIGDGELRSSLTADNIEVTGWQSRHQVLEIANQSNIFILTSRWEGLPMSLLEAMYLRKVCIVSDVIGNHDVIISGQNGFVCKSSDEFVNDILQQIGVNNSNAITETAHEDVVKSYSLDVMSNKYRELYSDTLR
ncbi:glycosyltransferase [Lapidilactobacillus bayanensis]|uniref:glycosyltransferase n=1 Tax=Lapidilactobacillus bayanensis TaxID=2485998 RepID=UPI000F77227A|nr:glycosyltransferase [Lapidilactobacillus bayanensis]